MIHFLLVFLSTLALGCAQARHQEQNDQTQQCVISEQERKALLELDYNSFDQSLPDGGWRKYDHCPLVTREIIDAYTAKHAATLKKDQWDVLVWHSGQLSANAGDYADAIAKMQQTLKPNEKPTDAFLWNPYANATIAFLKKDKPALLSERSKLARGMSPFNRVNLRAVDSFIRCFDSPYLLAYSAACTPAESTLEKIKSLAIPVNIKKSLPVDFFGLRDFFAMKKVILVGEMHGTETTPEFFGHLVASLADAKVKTLVLLEFPQSTQNAVDEFLKTGNKGVLRKNPFFAQEYQDGRASKAMVALLTKLSKLPNVTVLSMDPMDGIQTMTGQERDTGMAAFINSKRTGFDRTLVLTGNIHSRTSIGTPWDPAYKPMGYELKQMAKDLPGDQLFNVLVRYGKVDAWVCSGAEPSSCGPRYGKAVVTDYSSAVDYPSYFVWERELVDAHLATLFIRQAKLSFPFVKK